MKVSIFITCICDSFYPRVGEALVRVLKKQGVQLDFPPDQTCCGQPAINSGYWDDARTVATTMLHAFKDSQYVVTPSGSCLAAMQKFYPVLFGRDAQHYEMANDLLKKTHEFSQFLVKVLEVKNVGAYFPYRVTYHSSCHARRFLGIDEDVRTLLNNVRDLTFIPLPHEDLCCGFGGTFSVKMPEISEAMVDEKVAAIAGTGAEVLVGTDLGCLMNIGGRLKKQGLKVRVMHIAQLLDEGMNA